ncbi:type II toxin-antitoxin system RelE/ParE family toxin [Methylobacterium sp. CCH5-D2]|uniref:type II toxin-antitoxin system RelE/ParE family toxin n=1 Tax=Methylobacterium sp. CCH5-D2 TaxID=1768765 RepID=UPI0009E97DFE|nr:type II toxin-antitoxin system RelE/ParE family toxin [Methylobacterium sp. CCH5-D2]
MILNFYDSTTKAVFEGRCPKGFPAALLKAAQRKLTIMSAATSLADLKSPPSNKLHALKGNRAGQHAIAVNDQFRICFIWTNAGPDRVEFTDYH